MAIKRSIALLKMGPGDAVIPGKIIKPRHFIPWVQGKCVIATHQIKITKLIYSLRELRH